MTQNSNLLLSTRDFPRSSCILGDMWLSLDGMIFVAWKLEVTRKCPKGRKNMLQQYPQPNCWHSILQETSPWCDVRNGWGLTRWTYFTEGKMGQPSAAQLAKAWTPNLNNSCLTSMSSASICLLRFKLLKYLCQFHAVLNLVSIRTIHPHIYYSFFFFFPAPIVNKYGLCVRNNLFSK